MMASDVNDIQPSRRDVAHACLHTLLDINGLLDIGFDTNIRDCEMECTKETIRELRELIVRWSQVGRMSASYRHHHHIGGDSLGRD